MNRKEFFAGCLAFLGLGLVGCKIDKIPPKNNIKHRGDPKSLFEKIFNSTADADNDDDLTSYTGSWFFDSGHGVWTRYAAKPVNTDFYGKIQLN